MQALKFNISIRTYYYWRKKFEETGTIENKSRKPKNL
ncbi:helix-turn-helix domain-containing protein [Brachyspira hampsonii]